LRDDMPWTLDRFPLAMQRLLPAVRIKAIQIAFARGQRR
jgi:uncharacterized protein YdaT